MSITDHERYMRRAIELAAHAPDLPFGSCIVDALNDVIVAEGWNRSALNPTWHGEIDAINALAAAGTPLEDRDLILYTTAEPCPMCMAAILWTGIGTVVYGTSIATLQRQGWKQIDVRAEELVGRSPEMRCTILGGVLEAECDALFVTAIARRAI